MAVGIICILFIRFILGAQLNDLYTKTTHRVRQALFPEISIDDDFEELGNKNTSIVGSFAQPSQSLKNAILDLLSIRGGQVDIGTNTIPQLINNLNEDDPVREILDL